MANGHINGCLSLTSGDAADCKCASEAARYRTLAQISSVTFILEVVGGIWTGSLSLLSDAVHVLLDCLESTLSAFIAVRARKVTEGDALNEDRLRAIGGNVSAALIFVASLFILHEGLERLSSPHELMAGWAITIAAIGLVINIVQMFIHTRAPDEHHNVTHKWQWVHLASDIAGSACVIVGVGLSLFGFQLGDLAATLVIVSLIWFRVGRHLSSQFLGRTKHGHPQDNHPHPH